jgi:hypothetical protein
MDPCGMVLNLSRNCTNIFKVTGISDEMDGNEDFMINDIDSEGE